MRLLLGALTVALTAAPLAAQSVVSGRVTSSTDGRRIPGAEIRLEGPDTLVVRADMDGRWRVPLRPAGVYALRVRAMGHTAHVRELTVGLTSLDVGEVALAPVAIALDQMVVTAARREQRLGDAVTTVEVISRSDLERTGASDLASVLTEHTGIELQGGHPAGAGVMLQGIGSERVLVLLDGQPIAGRLSGNFDISRIPVAMVERVEVVKGAQSTLYGSEAMGGVVNIITRAPLPEEHAWGGVVGASAGQQGRRDATVRLTNTMGAWSSAVDVARRHVANAPGLPQEDGALATRLDGALKLRWSPDSARSAELSILALDERQRWRTGAFYAFSDNQQVNARVGGSWQRGRHRIAPGYFISQYDHVALASAVPLPISGDTGQRQLQRIQQAEVLYAGLYSPQLAVDAGVQVRVDEIETERVPGGLRVHTSVEPFAQAELTLHPRVSLVPGVRVSHSSIWGTQLTPRVAGRASLTDRLTVRASVGDGFRAPDFKELYLFFQNTSAGYAVLGNQALQPEHSRNVMLGTEYATPSGYWRTQFFRNDFRDFIETRMISAPSEAPVYEYVNRDNGSTHGFEVEAGGHLVRSGRVRGELGYSALRTRDDATGYELLARPGQSARAMLTLALPGAFRMSLSAIHTGRTPMQRDTSGAISSWRDEFTRLDVRVARAIAPLGLEFVLGADNVLDRRPAQWAGFTGRHVYTSFSYSFHRSFRP